MTAEQFELILANESHFILKRKLLQLVGQRFFIELPGNRPVITAHQEGFRLKERIYIGAEGAPPLMAILAREIFDFQGTYDVVDMVRNVRIGVLNRRGFESIVRDTWIVSDANEMPIGELTEDSLGLALVRRFLTALVPQNYDLMVQGRRAADLRQNFNPFTYHLNILLDPHARQVIDPRLVIAAGICLAALEGRQSG